MNISSLIYHNLCESRKSRKANYKRGSRLHCHHIIPIHMKGDDTDANFTYLTKREHQIAHYLLWRIHNNVNDLRSFHMLGGNLTIEMRKIIGHWCFENKIGMFAPSLENKKKEWRQKGIHTQIKNKVGIFDPSKMSYHASLGGKASIKTNKAFTYWFSKEGRKERSSLGGKSLEGRKSMHKPGDKTFTRVLSENIQDRLNEGYIFGSPLKPNLGKKLTSRSLINKRKRKVTDGITIFESVSSAAKLHGVSSASIINWIKFKKSNWCYSS